MKIRMERPDLFHQAIRQFLRTAYGQGRDVIDGLVRIELGALPTHLLQRIHDVGVNIQEPQLEYLEQAAGAGAYDDYVSFDGHFLPACVFLYRTGFCAGTRSANLG